MKFRSSIASLMVGFSGHNPTHAWTFNHWYKNGNLHRLNNYAVYEGNQYYYFRFDLYIELFLEAPQHILYLKTIIGE